VEKYFVPSVMRRICDEDKQKSIGFQLQKLPPKKMRPRSIGVSELSFCRFRRILSKLSARRSEE
jgi:hypothetical protein